MKKYLLSTASTKRLKPSVLKKNGAYLEKHFTIFSFNKYFVGAKCFNGFSVTKIRKVRFLRSHLSNTLLNISENKSYLKN